jgi:thiosulfate/3-mercaptopyruvate sulfurtransferase
VRFVRYVVKLCRHFAPATRWAIVMALVSCGLSSAGNAQNQASSRRAADPVVVWPSGPLEVIAAFAAPIDPSIAQSLVGRTIRYADVSGAGRDAAPSSRPGDGLRIVGAKLTDGAQTLTLATDPHPRAARYALPFAPAAADAVYDLTGVDASWTEGPDLADHPGWAGWWPTFDSESTRTLTQRSKPHQIGLALLSKPGRLILSTLARLPRGGATVRIDATGPIDEAIFGDVQSDAAAPRTAQTGTDHHVELATQSQGEPLFLSVTVRTGANAAPFAVRASYRLANDKTFQPLKRDQLLVPWTPLPAAAAVSAPLVVPDLSGGDAARGQTLFLGDQARCSQCHAFRGQGGKIGPDLTDLAKKDRAEIYRAIAAPSASIEPEYTSYTVATTSGQVLVGVVHADGPDSIRITDTNAHDTMVARGQIQEIRPSATSIMPVGLAGTLGDAALRDVIAFVTTAPPVGPGAQLLSFDELQKLLAQPNLRVLDAREKAEYDRGHIPGALWVDLKAAQQLSSSPRGLAARADWENWTAPLAIGPDTQVVIYDAQRQLSAARAWWLLSYLGVKNAGLLDGGYALWVKQSRPITKDVPAAVARPFPVAFQRDRLATRVDVERALKSHQPVMDARTDREFTGEEARTRRGGHIPAACHLEWTNLVDADGRFPDAQALRAKLVQAGIKPDQPVIAHCQSGGRASVNAFVLERLGIPARNYYLGWSEWGNADDTPIEKAQ